MALENIFLHASTTNISPLTGLANFSRNLYFQPN
jgi:hypothetical protein